MNARERLERIIAIVDTSDEDIAAARAIDAALVACINVLNSEHTHCTCPDDPCKMFELNKRLKALGYSPEDKSETN